MDRLISSLSEADAGRHADNLITNEDSFASVGPDIRRRTPDIKKGTFLGVGPEQNLTFLSHSPCTLGFIVDFRRRNLRVHLLHKALLALSDERIGYLTRLTA